MAYSALNDIKKVLPEARLVQLTDDKGDGVVDGDKVTEAIGQADSEIDTYLGGRYDVPLMAPVSPVVKRCSGDIAIYILYKRRVEEIPDARRMAYKDALRVLEQIRDGKMALPVTTSAESFASAVQVSSHFGDDDA